MLVVFRHKTHTHKTHKTKKTKAKQLNVTLDRHAFGFGTAFEPEKVEEVAPRCEDGACACALAEPLIFSLSLRRPHHHYPFAPPPPPPKTQTPSMLPWYLNTTASMFWTITPENKFK